MHKTADAVFAGNVPGGGPWIAVLSLRLSLVFAGVILAMYTGADPIGLLIGLSLVMPATIAAAVWHRPAITPQEPFPAVDPDDPIWDDYSVWSPGRKIKNLDEETE